MKPEELLELCKKQEEMGLDRLVLKMPYPKLWLKRGYGSRRVRTPFGLCEYSQGWDSLLIYPRLEQVYEYFQKVFKT